MKTITIPPSKADMKRGALGPSPVRVNTLWNEQRARAAGQYSADVSARNRETGEFVRVTGDFGGEIVDGVLVPNRAACETMDTFRGARNRAACRAGHVLVGRYVAAREAEREIPAPTSGGVIYGPPTPWSKEGQAMRLLRPVEARHHTIDDAVARILALS